MPARQTGPDRKTVRKYLAEGLAARLDDLRVRDETAVCLSPANFVRCYRAAADGT